MKILIFSVTLFLLICDGVITRTDNNDGQIQLYKRIPKIKTSLTEKEKGQIMDGVRGAANFFKFLSEKNFFSTLTKISSVAGPVFTAISAILTVVFMFIDIESPEMALMKVEFQQLNNRIDRWNIEFNEIKKKIDWSAIQINFADFENNIISLHRMVMVISNVPAESRESYSLMFINSYEINYRASGDLLFSSISNVERIYSENLFRAAQRYMENDRNLVQEFMVSLVQLLTMSMQVEAMYVKLKYNTEEASSFTQSLWEKKLTIVKEKMEQIDLDTKNKYEEQYQIDLDKLLLVHRSLSNQQFAKVIYEHLTKKYNWREWFVLIYGELTGFNDHTYSTCSGTHRFRTYGRNVILSSVDQNYGDLAVNHITKNQGIIGSYNSWTFGKEFAIQWVEYIRTKLPYCSDVITVAAVSWGSNVWYYSNRLVIYKKNCFQENFGCFNTFLFA